METTTKYYSIEDIKCHNKTAGYCFFSPDTMRFFRSRVLDTVYQGIGGIYFVTSEQFKLAEYRSKRLYAARAKRLYTVRKYNPETGDIDTAGDFNKLSKYKAQTTALRLSNNQ